MPSFSALQAALKAGSADAFVYYTFDLLYRDGHDLRALPLGERKDELAELVGHDGRGAIRFSEHFTDSGARMLDHACAMGLEGIVSKKLNEPYRSGRSEAFVKVKCSNAQELVVGGYAPSNVMPNAIGALVVGVYDDGELHYAGRVGTGYSQAVARDLWKRLHPLEIAKPPFDDIPRAERRAARWVKPTMVIEANLGGWTSGRPGAAGGVQGRARGQAGAGGRARGTGDGDEASRARRRNRGGNGQDCARQVSARRGASRRRCGRQAAPGGDERRSTGRRGALHPSRPRLLGRRRHHQAGPRRLLPRGLGLDGAVRGEPSAQPGALPGRHGGRMLLPEARLGRADRKLTCAPSSTASAGRSSRSRTSTACSRWCRPGVLEVHVRGSMIDSLELCDRIVFDLDPGEGVGWSDIVAAARDVRERLAGIELDSFVKLSGGKGLHVVVPIEGADWDTVKTFAQTVATTMAVDAPDRYLAKMTKARARRPDLHRLSPQFAGADIGRGLFDARARRRAGLGAGDLGGTRPHQGRQPVHGAQSRQAPAAA